MWPGVYARTGLTLACSQREKVGAYAACQCLHWPPFMSCTLLYVPPTWPFRWGLVPYIHTYIHTCIHTYIHTHIHTYIHISGRRATLRGRRGTWWRPPWLHARSFCVAGASLMALGDIHLDFTWHAVWHNLTSMTPAVDHDYIPGMITSHRACRKSSQNLRLRPKECGTLLWSAEVWRAHHRFDRGLCHKRSFGKQRREKNHQSLVELEEGEWDTSWDLVFSTHPWIPQRISVVSISCFFSGLQWQVTI